VVAGSKHKQEKTHGYHRFVQEGRQQFPGRDRHPQFAEEGRPHRRGIQPRQRQSPEPPRLCGPRRDRRSLVEALGEGRDYLSLKLDDPSFTAPIYANLFDDEAGEGYTLLWSRPKKTGE
jgi:hypothetical protein